MLLGRIVKASMVCNQEKISGYGDGKIGRIAITELFFTRDPERGEMVDFRACHCVRV